MKTLAILTNGGDTCALNASIKSIRDSAYRVGYRKIYGVRRGYQGLLDGTLEDITLREIDVTIGGSCLGSMRTSPTKLRKSNSGEYEIDEDNCSKMAQTLHDYEVDVLVVIGGDGTLQATRQFQGWIQAKSTASPKEFRKFDLLGFLKTIDNDIRTYTHFQGVELSLCPGFPSAVQKIVQTVEALRVTARTAERAFVVETMGRDAGWLAASACFGGAEILVIPEIRFFYERKYREPEERKLYEQVWKKAADWIARFYRHNRNVIVAVAEGFRPPVESFEDLRELIQILKNLYGPRKQVGATELLAITMAPVLEFYFACLSELGGHGVTEEQILRRISDLMDSESKQAKRYRDSVKPGKHPLENWRIEEKLREAFGIEASKDKTPAAGADAGRPDEMTPGQAAPPAVAEELRKWDRMPECSPPYRFEIRPHRTDYVPRSGQPSAYDYKLATVLGQKVGEMLEMSQFGKVPCLEKVVPYDELCIEGVTTVDIEQIRTLKFDRDDYFDVDNLHISDRITDFFRTITTGPKDLQTAITDMEKKESR